MSTILGINLNSHDSGAAILKDGKVLSAINEERLSRRKMDGRPPYKAIDEAFVIAKLSPKDIDVLAISDMPFGIKRSLWFMWQQQQRVWFTKGGYIKSFFTSPKSWNAWRLFSQCGYYGLTSSWQSKKATRKIVTDLRAKGFAGSIRLVNHDRAHAAGAFYTSGMKEAFIGIIEGSSFTNACSYWVGNKDGLKRVAETKLPHSPGRYYEIVTLFLGFRPKRHEGKITGLAALGDPKVCYDKVKDLLFIKDGDIRVSPALYNLHDEYFARGKKLPRRFENDTPANIAAAFQKRLEDVIVEKFKIMARTYSLKNLVLSGGVAANVKMNMEISRIPEVKELFIHPGMGDMGQALGAAYAVHADTHSGFEPITLKDVYFGPSFSDTEIETALKEKSLSYKKVPSIATTTGELLAKNKVVAMCQGRMEYGPRALGNRTIMYPAVDAKVNDWLNKQLNRTEFMPFAPVTLAERAKDCYVNLEKGERAARFMTITAEVTPYMAKNMPAAVHVDHTARPQIIDRDTNPIYYDAIKTYEKLTGLPSVINTSFNMHEEPIVCSPDEAVSAFLASHLDALAIGNYIVLKEENLEHFPKN